MKTGTLRRELFVKLLAYILVALNCSMKANINVIKETDVEWKKAKEYLNNVSELNYLTQIVIMLYEDTTVVSVRYCNGTEK